MVPQVEIFTFAQYFHVYSICMLFLSYYLDYVYYVIIQACKLKQAYIVSTKITNMLTGQLVICSVLTI